MKQTLFLVLVVLTVPAASRARRHAGAPPPQPLVVVKEAQSTPVFDSLIYPAKLASKVNAALVAETDGVIKEIVAPLGTPIKAGAAVFTLINPDPIYTFSPFTVHSPVDGVVSQVAVAVGSRVTKGQNLGVITDPGQVHARIEVTVSDLAAIHVGMRGFLEVDRYKPREMVVAGISPLIDPATGTATAELRMLQQRNLPPPGLVGRVRFRARLHKGIELPESAVFYRGEQAVVRVLEGDKAVFRTVKLGPSRQGKFEILEGIRSGEAIVLRTNTFISDGETVTVQKDEAGT